MKSIIITFCVLSMIGLLPIQRLAGLTYLTLVFIFFPIFIPFLGKDAVTTGTIAIFILYLKYLGIAFFKHNVTKEPYDYWIYLLIFLGGVSVIMPYAYGNLDAGQLVKGIKYYLGFSAALLFFTIIKNFDETSDAKKGVSTADHIEKMLNFFLVMISIHVLLAIAFKIVPSIEAAMSVFYPRTSESVDIALTGVDAINRIQTFVLTPESFGECLAVVSPIILYKIFKASNLLWIGCFVTICAGEVMAVTRSGIVLFFFGCFFSVMFHLREKPGKSVALSLLCIVGFLLTLVLIPSIYRDLITRFSMATETYKSGGSFIEVINRPRFVTAWQATLTDLTFFGNGIAPANFHNIIMTNIYKLGIIGSMVFFGVFLYPLFCLINAYNNPATGNKALVFSCILSMTLFLINETKYEFTRNSSYQQICWGLIATYYLSSRLLNRKKEGVP